MRQADIAEFTTFLREFQGETDRGAALVGAALIDSRLEQTLAAFMVAGPHATELLRGGSAPLGSFSSRIKLSFALGLIDEHECHECGLIRKVRNEFAHQPHGLSFQHPLISGFCGSLRSDLPGGRESFTGNPRGVFINAVVLIALGLTYRAERVGQQRRITKRWP